jgi:C4-dicarboxylate-specific signal transduction histidine kinase
VLVEAKARELLSERHHRDIAERESRLRLAELAHMNRNASATVYCAALVHELNQPLAAIMSNADAAELFLTMDPPQLADVADILCDIRRDDLRASDLIQRMRALLKKSEPETEALDLNEVVRNSVALLASEARMRKVALRLELGEAALPVAGDRIQLQQVMINLVLNAMDAMAATPEPQRALRIRVAAAGAEREVRVSDAGSGFAGGLDRVFDSFFTTKPQGMGLGLSIAAAIVAAHGGRIWAENNPDGGGTVGFRLPACGAGTA